MANIIIDGKEYDADSISDEAKATLASLQFTQSELQRANAQVAVLKTAEAAYVKSLKEVLEKD